MSEQPNYSDPKTWLGTRRENAEAVLNDVVKDVAGTARLERALLGYQQRAVYLIETGCSVLIIEKSRRIGMTWGLAAEAVLRAARAKSSGGCDFLYISYSQDMTKEFVDACAMWAKLFQCAASEVGEFIFKDELEGDETRSIQAYQIKFASGFEIVGLSSAPRALRGRQGVVMIDEAAFVDSLPELMKSALAMLMWGGQVIVCSTHNGTDNPFNQLVQDTLAGRNNYKHMHVDLDKALADGLYKRICLVGKKPWSAEGEAKWRDALVKSYGDGANEELFCIPSQGSGAWLSTELIERQMTEAPDKIVRWVWPADYLQWSPERQAKHLAEKLRELDLLLAGLDARQRHALGFDFARVSDLSVLSVLGIDHVLKRVAGLVLELRNVPYEEQFQITDYIWKKMPRPNGGAFDATGAGGYVAEAMARRHGIYDAKLETGGMIAQIKFSVEWYRLNMPKLKSAFEDGTIAIIKDDEHLSDLRTVKLVRGVAQVPDVRKGVAGLKRHGDFAVSLALAWYATLMNTATYGYETLGASSGGRDTFNTPPSQRMDDAQGRWRTPLGADIRGTL